MGSSIFTEISFVLVAAFLVASLMRLLKQPLIIGYIISGLLLGPFVLDLLGATHILDTASHIGVALLLFIVGLRLDPKEIKEVGWPAVAVGTGQIAASTAIGFGLSQAFGYSLVEAAFIGIGLALSSTIIILKTISDRKDGGRLYAKLATGYLLVQDFVAAGLLVYISSVGASESILLSGIQSLTWLMAVGSILSIIAYVLLPKISRFFVQSQEYLFLFAIAWGFGVSSVISATGLSIEIGALLAGVLLSSQMYAKEVSNRLQPLRDFFLLFFFITLGAEINPGVVSEFILPVIGFSAFVLLVQPVIIMTLTGYLGYSKHTSLKTGVASGQVSEFSLIFILLAAEVGQVGDEIVGLITATALVTIAGSTYMMRYDEAIYNWLGDWLDVFEQSYAQDGPGSEPTTDVFVFGYARNSRNFVQAFQRKGRDFMVVDFDPDKIDELNKSGIPHVFGDVSDPDFLEDIRLEAGNLAVSTISDFETNVYLVNYIKNINPDMVVVVYSQKPKRAAELYRKGATYVIMPHFLGEQQVLETINGDSVTEADFLPYRDEHLRYIQDQLE